MSFTVRRPVDKEDAKEALGRVFRLIAACGRKVRGGKIRVRYVRQVSIEPQFMSMFVDATGEALKAAFVQTFQGTPAAVISLNILEALRSIIEYHPDEGIRIAYTFEINQLLEGIK